MWNQGKARGRTKRDEKAWEEKEMNRYIRLCGSHRFHGWWQCMGDQ